MLVEPSSLPPEGKKHVADWLCKSQADCSVAVILTTPWHIPASAQVQPLQLARDGQLRQLWQQSSAEVWLYQGAEAPLGAGPSSGKSSCIQHECQAFNMDMISCILHEGFQAGPFVEEAAKEIRKSAEAGQRNALHIDLSAYSDFHVTKTFLRHLLLCQVLHDPDSGQMVHLPPDVCIYVEVGRKAGKRDLHASRPYATEELLQVKFPKIPTNQQSLNLLYPILRLVGQDATFKVNQAPLQCGERRFAALLQLEGEEETHWSVTCDRCQAHPVCGACYHCQDCQDFDLCNACFQQHRQSQQLHDSTHEFRRRLAPERCALALRLMQAYQQAWAKFSKFQSKCF